MDLAYWRGEYAKSIQHMDLAYSRIEYAKSILCMDLAHSRIEYNERLDNFQRIGFLRCRPLFKTQNLCFLRCRPLFKVQHFGFLLCRPLFKTEDFGFLQCRPLGTLGMPEGLQLCDVMSVCILLCCALLLECFFCEMSWYWNDFLVKCHSTGMILLWNVLVLEWFFYKISYYWNASYSVL